MKCSISECVGFFTDSRYGLIKTFKIPYRLVVVFYKKFSRQIWRNKSGINRLIRGVAGSGKTLILVWRAKLLSKAHPEWKILVLCYNISLANGIRQMINQKLSEPEDLWDFDFTTDEGVNSITN
mgnify:CR=1 FL=1